MADQTQRLEIATVKAEVGSKILYLFSNAAEDAQPIATESGEIRNLKQVIAAIQEEGAEKISVATTIYQTAAAGLAATTDGGIYLVQSSEADEIYTVWKNQAGAAVNTGKTAMSSQAIQDALTASNEAAQAAEEAADVATARTAGFLSPASEAPTSRDDGLPLQVGDRYFNTVDQAEYLFQVDGWVANESLEAIHELRENGDSEKGASLVGWDGSSVGAQMDLSKKLADYSAARSYKGSATRVEITQADISGIFNRRPYEIGDADNGGTILISIDEQWTLVRDYPDLPNPLWFGADKKGVNSSDSAFNAAAAISGQVVVTSGTYLLTSATATALWVLNNGVAITGLPPVGGNSLMDLSRLTGRVMAFQAGGRIGFRLGDSSPWLEKNIRNFSESLSNAVFLSPEGRIGGLFGSRTSGNNSANMATIGISAYGVNDNVAVPKTSYSAYLELVRFANCGPAYNIEMDGVNLGDTYVIDPYKSISAYDGSKGTTAHLWLSCGGGDSGLSAGSNNMSAAIVSLPNSKMFDKGWVVRSGSIATGEMIAAPTGYKYSWYSAAGIINSFIDHRTIDQRTRIDSGLGNSWFSRKNRASGATVALDTIHQHIFYSGEATETSYTGGSFTVRQRAAFLNSNARHSIDFQARNQDGTYSELSLNGVSDRTIAPVADGAMSLGGPSNRFNNSYFSVAPTVTSDERMKSDIQDIHDSCLDAWQDVQYRQWKSKESVEEKGDDARWHTGLIAQNIKLTFESHGLNAHDYGLLCYDEWPQQDEILHYIEAEFDDRGVEIRPARSEVVQKFRPAGNRYGVRYEEALAFEAALMRRTTKRLEARLSALEGNSSL